MDYRTASDTDLHAKDIQGKDMTELHPLMQIECKDIQHMKRPSDLQGIWLQLLPSMQGETPISQRQLRVQSSGSALWIRCHQMEKY